MDIDNLKKSIKEDRESGLFSLQSIFDRHIDEFDRLKLNGYSYKKMHLILNLDIAYRHYTNLLYRARCKKIKKGGVEDRKPIQIATNLVSTNNKYLNEKGESEEYNKTEWIKVFNFIQPVRDTPVLDSTIKTLLKAGWTTENYHILREKYSITTFRRLIDAVSFIRSSKFRKNIFKDNKICT